MKKYKQNLEVIESKESKRKGLQENYKVYSYGTLVARISGDIIIKVEWEVDGKTSSPTTTKHINYVAKELDLIKDWEI